ncbi:ABC transporter permease [Pedobacter psychroterrae]|uniref:ABC transporter permease n=1 Tax=Pedobacter psychroterrae TaxID=2530453 RepID=A0A4R0NPN1_9SPHI|nr:ABC transporter permease [Pedobacter psychroterrae]TCD02911.1 ABC transporter permease [Pedobacter psychroterrae]
MEELSLKIAWRNLWKNKGFTLINLGGLAIGLAASMLLLLYVANEWKFNTQFNDVQNIYEVKVNHLDNLNSIKGTGNHTPNVLAGTMKAEFPGIKNAAMITWSTKTLLVYGDKSIKVENRFAEPDILKILSYKFVSGSAETAFRQPNSIVLTQSAARMLFGNATALNKGIKFMNFATLKVTGVIEDLPENIDYQFESLVSLNENQGIFIKDAQWQNYSFYTLLTLNKGVNVDDFNSGFRKFLKRHNTFATAEPFIYPLLKSHLHGEFKNGVPDGGRIQQVKIFIGLALGILVIACINFMNLATARAGKRAREVGVRKAIGATRKSLMLQFLLESMIMVLISLVLAIVMIELSLPIFNSLLNTQLHIRSLDVYSWLLVLIGVFVTGIIAGSYPAFYLSSFEPVNVLKGAVTKNGNHSSVTFRQVLVVIQFSFAVLLITGTIVIYNQLQLIKNRPIGYNSSALVEMPMEGMLFQKYDLLKARLLQSGAVNAMCKTTASISTRNSTTSGLEWEGMSPSDKNIDFNQIFTTSDFSKTMGIKMIKGVDFNEKMASDTAGILLNQTAVTAMNLKQPIGTTVTYGKIKRTVIGVFEDIIWAEPTKKEMPMIILWASFIPDVITMRLNPLIPVDLALEKVNKVTKELNQVYPVELTFVDSLYQAKFDQERTLSILSNLFGGLSIFISCLGLLGLSAYSAELRTKEIGIRKVLGASHFSIVNLLCWNFIKMVMIAIGIGLPLSYYLMGIWLAKFDFRTEITGFMMLSSAGFIILIAYLTVSYQAIKAASVSPINAIKYE